MTEPIASVIIPAHNAADTLHLQLAALASQDDPPAFEVIVVANNCTDETVQAAEAFCDRLALRVIVADDKPSAAYARNIGASSATGIFLLFCDADDQVNSTWVAGMVEPLAAHRADFVGGVISVNREGLADWIYDWKYREIDQQCFVGTGDLPFALSASLGIRASPFGAIGGFDERFPGAGTEELDLCWRLLRSGYRLGEARDAVVLYEPRRALRAVLAQTRGYVRGGYILSAKEGSLPASRSRLSTTVLTAKVAAHQVIRKKEFRPSVVYAKTMHTFYHGLECRRLQEGFVGKEPSHFDFGVRPSVPLIGGLAFAADRRSDAEWYGNAGVEPRSLAAVDRYLPSGGVFVDVGANVGTFSVAAALKVGEHGRVLAFEPSGRARSLLEMNLDRHGVSDVVEVRDEAVGSERESRTFRTYDNGMVSGFGVAPSVFSPGELLEERPVEVVSMSEEIAGSVDMIKIDVEGFEADVLHGAKALIERSPSVALLLEFNPASLDAAGRQPSEVFTHFPLDQWSLFLLDEESEAPIDDLVPFDPNNWQAADHPPSWYANILAFRKA